MELKFLSVFLEAVLFLTFKRATKCYFHGETFFCEGFHKTELEMEKHYCVRPSAFQCPASDAGRM